MSCYNRSLHRFEPRDVDIADPNMDGLSKTTEYLMFQEIPAGALWNGILWVFAVSRLKSVMLRESRKMQSLL